MIKLPQPEMHSVNSSEGGRLKAGRQQAHSTDDIIVRTNANGPTTIICVLFVCIFMFFFAPDDSMVPSRSHQLTNAKTKLRHETGAGRGTGNTRGMVRYNSANKPCEQDKKEVGKHMGRQATATAKNSLSADTRLHHVNTRHNKDGTRIIAVRHYTRRTPGHGRHDVARECILAKQAILFMEEP